MRKYPLVPVALNHKPELAGKFIGKCLGIAHTDKLELWLMPKCPGNKCNRTADGFQGPWRLGHDEPIVIPFEAALELIADGINMPVVEIAGTR
jgi:hypothetical protein